MGLTDFQIVFEKPMPTYFSGETVNGQLVVNLSSEKKMERIKVSFNGKGKVRWTEQETTRDSSGNDHSHTVTYSDEETYFSYEIDVYNGPQLPNGIHNFPFSFTLPYNIPSSFESHVGNVRYEVKGQIVRDWKWDHRVRKMITVNGVLDLNAMPECKDPGENRNHKTLCCLCCASGPISAVIHTNRTGYVPGEMIGFGAEVDNQSSREMDGSRLKLIERVCYMTPRKNKTETRVIAEIARGPVKPGESDMWEGVTMRVPAIPPTNLAGNSRIISVNYTLDFHVDPSGASFDLVVSLPLTIGTIPLQEYMKTLAPPVYQPAPYSTEQFGPSDPPGGGPSISQVGPWMPPSLDIQQMGQFGPWVPPTYAESVWGTSNVRDEDDKYLGGDTVFIPKYALYNTNY